MSTQQLLNIFIGIIVSFLSSISLALAIAAFKFAWTTNGSIKETNVKIGILFEAYQKEVSDAMTILHKPHEEAKKTDELLEKFQMLLNKFDRKIIEDVELLEFIKVLTAIYNDTTASSGDRTAASKVLTYVEMRCRMMQLGV